MPCRYFECDNENNQDVCDMNCKNCLCYSDCSLCYYYVYDTALDMGICLINSDKRSVYIDEKSK